MLRPCRAAFLLTDVDAAQLQIISSQLVAAWDLRVVFELLETLSLSQFPSFSVPHAPTSTRLARTYARRLFLSNNTQRQTDTHTHTDTQTQTHTHTYTHTRTHERTQTVSE